MPSWLSTAIIVVFTALWAASVVADIHPSFDYTASPLLHAGMAAIVGAATGHKIVVGRRENGGGGGPG